MVVSIIVVIVALSPLVGAFIWTVRHPDEARAQAADGRVRLPCCGQLESVPFFLVVHRYYVLQDTKANGAGVQGFKVLLNVSVQLLMLYPTAAFLCAAFIVPKVTADGTAHEVVQYLQSVTVFIHAGVLVFFSITGVWSPGPDAAALHKKRVSALAEEQPAVFQMRQMGMERAESVCQHVHETFLRSISFLLVSVALPLVLEFAIIVFAFSPLTGETLWPVPKAGELVSIIFLFVAGSASLVAVQFYSIGEFTRNARYCIFLQQHLAMSLRAVLRELQQSRQATCPNDEHDQPNARVCGQLSDWLQVRIFTQHEDINFFFRSASPLVGSLIMLAITSAGFILLHAFHLVTLEETSIIIFVIVAAWSGCMSYFMALYIMQIDTSTNTQRKLLNLIAFEVGRNLSLKQDTEWPPPTSMQTVARILEYMKHFDEPPTVLGVRVDPSLLAFLNRSLASIASAGAVSIVTNRLKGGNGDSDVDEM